MLRWVDTKVMIADPLTKPMSDYLLQHVLDTGRWNVSQPLASKHEKEKKAQWRQAQRHANKGSGGGDSKEQDEPFET